MRSVLNYNSIKKYSIKDYFVDEVKGFIEGAKNTLNPKGYCNGNSKFSTTESIVSYILIGGWVAIAIGEAFGLAKSNTFLNSTIALILGFLFGKNKVT